MKKNYYAKALALTVAASMVSVPAFAAEGTDDPQAQEKTVEQDEQKGEKSAEEEQEKTEQLVKEEKIEDGISAASDDDQETAVAEGEVFAKGDDCGATEEDEVSWELVKNNDTLYRKAEENGYSYATTAEDGYEEVDGYTLTISGEGNIADYYGKNITIDSFEGDIAPWRRALLSDVEADRTTQEVVPITKVIVEDGITGIGTDAFSYLALNGTITFNENVTYYGSGVYSYCPLITTVDFTNFKPKNVSDYWIPGHEMLTGSAVPYGFFDRDKSLNTCIVDGKTYTGELALPERIDTICTAAFRGTGFDTINFDNGLKDIKEVGPYGMSNLANIDTFTYPGNVDFYSGENPNGNKTSSVVLTGSSIKKLIIQKDVKELPDAFAYQLKALEKVIFEGEIESIGSNAFGGCEKLESVELGKVKSMGNGVFINCPSLKSLKIEGDENLVLSSNTVASWGTNWPGAAPLETFELGAGTINFNLNGKKDTLKEVKLGDGVKDIPDYFLSGCTKLETLEIGNGITKIGNHAFEQTDITSITIPDSVTAIGEQAFNGCTSLMEVNIPKNSKLETIGNRAFQQTNITSIAIPDSVTVIGKQAFNRCTSLTEVNISKNSKLETIGDGAFYDTRVLKMYLPGGVKTLGVGAFQRTPVEIYDMSDVYSSDFTIGDWCINNWYDTKNGEVKPEWADKHKDIYVNNNDILNALLADRKAGSVTKTCYVTNGGTVDMTKTGFAAVSRPGYTVEWHQKADFSDTAYIGEPQNGKNYYAKWTLKDSTNTIEVTYDANIRGVTAKTYAEIKGNEHLAKASSFSRAGYTFTGWNTAKNGTGTAYAVGDKIPSGESITVYAQWTLNAPTVSVTGNATKQYDGGNVTLTAATPVSGVTYQWQKDGVDIDGATNATYTVKNVADSGKYTVEITDTDGKTAVSSATAISITKKEVAVPTVESKIYNGTVLKADVTGTADYEVTKNEGGKNAGAYDVVLTLKDADNYKWADSEEAAKTVPFTVVPKKVELTVDNSTLKGAGSVTFTVDGVCEGDTAKVVCDVDSIKVEGLKASLPNATMEYTFTTDMGGNYEPASCVVSVTRRKSSSSSSDTSAPTYGVSTGKTENGEISVTPAKAEAGETVTIKATPDSGYQLDKMTVKDKNNSTVKLKKVGDNEYTFTMPVGKVSVDATFVQKDAADDSNAAEAGKTIKLQIGSRIVNVDNEAVIYDAAPVIRNDRTLVPIRIITEALGGKVDWNGATKEVTLSINDKEIKMTIGKTLEKYGVAPVIIDGRTFVPVRFVADELGANVAWDDATKTVTIKTAR